MFIQRETHNSLGAVCLPYREERILGDLLGQGVGEHSGVGEAVVVDISAEDDMVENPDAEDFRCFN